MKKIYSIKCNKYGKFNDLKKSYIFNETLVLFLNCDKCNKIFKEEESIRILKIVGLIIKYEWVKASNTFDFVLLFLLMNMKIIYNYFKEKYGWKIIQ